MIDLRSDTVTRPTEPMRAAMARAEVGDDVYGEDPTVRDLEEHVADLLGHEAALFTATGSLANVLAVRALVPPGREVLCAHDAHIARAELGAHGAISGVTMRTWTAGPLALDQVRGMYAPDLGPYFVPTAAVSVENTHNFSGGRVLPVEDLRALRGWADEVGCALHLDGARLWNAAAATSTPLRAYGELFEAVAVCLSKGLGAPVGSLLVGPESLVAEARVWRKRLGGGMRQVGVLAAAGRYALDHHRERLGEDHVHARILADACGVDPATVETNMVVVPDVDAAAVVAAAGEAGVRVGAVGARTVRAVTHLDVSRAQVEEAASVLARALASTRPTAGGS